MSTIRTWSVLMAAVVMAPASACFPNPDDLRGDTTATASGGTPAAGGAGGGAGGAGAGGIGPGGAGAGGVMVGAGPNNTVDLMGAPVGTGAYPVDMLRKKLDVLLTSPMPAGLELGQAYAMRTYGTGNSILYVVPVTNHAQAIACDVQAVNSVLRDGAGAPVWAATASDRTPLYGTVAITRDLWNNFCVGPEETGYLLDIELPPQGSVANYYVETVRLEMAVLAPSMAVQRPATRVLPTSYTMAPGMFTLTVHNEGPAPARLAHLTPFLMLDAQGPVAWNLLTPVMAAQVLPAGGDGSLSDTRVNTEGRADRVRALVELEDPSTPVPTALHVDDDHQALVMAAAARSQRLLRAWQDGVRSGSLAPFAR